MIFILRVKNFQTALDHERRAEIDFLLFRGGRVRTQVKAEEDESRIAVEEKVTTSFSSAVKMQKLLSFSSSFLLSPVKLVFHQRDIFCCIVSNAVEMQKNRTFATIADDTDV